MRGSRRGSTVALTPNLRRLVRPATAASVVRGSSAGWGETRRSLSQTESTGPSSQASTQRQKASALEKGKAMKPRPTRTLTALSLADERWCHPERKAKGLPRSPSAGVRGRFFAALRMTWVLSQHLACGKRLGHPGTCSRTEDDCPAPGGSLCRHANGCYTPNTTHSLVSPFFPTPDIRPVQPHPPNTGGGSAW